MIPFEWKDCSLYVDWKFRIDGQWTLKDNERILGRFFEKKTPLRILNNRTTDHEFRYFEKKLSLNSLIHHCFN